MARIQIGNFEVADVSPIQNVKSKMQNYNVKFKSVSKGDKEILKIWG
jgi:hypothetical protein